MPVKSPRGRQAGVLMTDLVVAVAFLCLAVIPLTLSFSQERRLVLTSYQRVVAMEIVDGEMELLAAGGWRNYSNGVFQLTSPARAAANLPPGRLELTVTNQHFLLEWRATDARPRTVRREFVLP